MDGLKVFVLGPARSGTSITYSCMRQVFRLPGRGESHTMPAFQTMLAAFDQYKTKKKTQANIMLKDLSRTRVETAIYELARGFYNDQYPAGSWVDKSPGPLAIRGIPLIRAVFPDARIIVTKRSGIETVNSFHKKFGMSISAACKVWVSCMEAVLWAEENCPGVLFVEQFDMSNRTQKVADEICAYLGQPGKSRAVNRFLSENDRQKTSTHDMARLLTLDDVGWPAADRETFMRISGEMMRRLSYPT